MNETDEDKAPAEAADRLDGVVMPDALDIEKMLNSRCSYCEDAAQGNYSIHRDGFGIGPEVPLCNSCGAHTDPSEEVIWAKISEA